MNPQTFTEAHYSLAEHFGIPRERIKLVGDASAMRAAARNHGVPEEEVMRYSDTTLGNCIQADDIPGGPDVWIYLRTPIKKHYHCEVYCRFKRYGVAPLLELCDTERPSLLQAFLLLHEIAHHVLRHGPNDPYDRKEIEADKWAVNQLTPIAAKFP